jgi:predicted nucleic acid-binding protein
MILVDTSIWIDHFRFNNAHLSFLLKRNEVCIHPFIIGELACGNLKNRPTLISLLASLPQAVLAEHDEVMFMIDHHTLMGKGIGYIDIHLLTSTLLSKHTWLWSKDIRLSQIALSLDCEYQGND